MKLSPERQIETGAFYTPKIWADLAVQYIRKVVPNLEDYIFWDMAAGEGALLEALPEGCQKYGTTLEWEDYCILKDKGFICNQFDFLHGDMSCLLELRSMPRERLIVFTNPPYITLPADNESYAKIKYKTNDVTALFLYRIFKEVKPVLCCYFAKLDLMQSQKHIQTRRDLPLYENSLAKFISPSKSWGLNGDFSIQFSIDAPYQF